MKHYLITMLLGRSIFSFLLTIGLSFDLYSQSFLTKSSGDGHFIGETGNNHLFKVVEHTNKAREEDKPGQSTTLPVFAYSLVDGDTKEYIEFANYKRYTKKQEVLKDTTLSNGLTYKQIRWSVISNSMPESMYYEYQRIDLDGNVHIYYNNTDQLLYVFNINTGAYFFPQYHALRCKIAKKYSVLANKQSIEAIDFNLIDSTDATVGIFTVVEKYGLSYYLRYAGATYEGMDAIYAVKERKLWGAILKNDKIGEVLAISKETSLLDFYPLTKGNMWKYSQPTSGFITTNIRESIKDTILSDNNTYSKISETSYLASHLSSRSFHYERIDENANIFDSYRAFDIFRRYKLSACVGDTFYFDNQRMLYRIDNKFSYYDPLTKDNRICILISLKETAAKNDLYFSKGLGIREIGSEGGQPSTLVGAYISGQSYGDTARITSVKMNEDVLTDFNLYQNYPNPFNPVTTIRYIISKDSHVELKVYDMLGREVSTLVNKEQTAGEHKVQFDGRNLPSGVYIYTIQAGQFRDSKKLLLLK